MEKQFVSVRFYGQVDLSEPCDKFIMILLTTNSADHEIFILSPFFWE